MIVEAVLGNREPVVAELFATRFALPPAGAPLAAARPAMVRVDTLWRTRALERHNGGFSRDGGVPFLRSGCSDPVLSRVVPRLQPPDQLPRPPVENEKAVDRFDIFICAAALASSRKDGASTARVRQQNIAVVACSLL